MNEQALRKRVFDVLNENLIAENKTYDIAWTHSETGDRLKVTTANCEQLHFESETYLMGFFEHIQYFIINNIIIILISAGSLGYLASKVRHCFFYKILGEKVDPGKTSTEHGVQVLQADKDRVAGKSGEHARARSD